jgi:hypothetical protein
MRPYVCVGADHGGAGRRPTTDAGAFVNPRSRRGTHMEAFLTFSLAERFGRSQAFGIGLAFLSFIFFPILGFGDARYMPQRYAKAA